MKKKTWIPVPIILVAFAGSLLLSGCGEKTAEVTTETTTEAEISQEIADSNDADAANTIGHKLSDIGSEQTDTGAGLSDDSNNEGKETATVNIPESDITSETAAFTTTTLDGEAVTEEIFADYDITVVHVWGTYCGPCIKEMGEYAQLYKDIPENVNVIGVLVDVYDGSDDNVDSAKEILANAGAEFTNLKTSESVYEMTKDFMFVPSSFFVDSKGHVIGKKLDGASYSTTIENLYNYLD